MKRIAVTLSAIGVLVVLIGAHDSVTGRPVQAGAAVADPAEKGPYEVGHVSFVVSDATRPAPAPFNVRPIAVDLYYPVDARDITADTPEALYLLDPYYQTWRTSVSSDWEYYGLDGAYEAPSPSTRGPFPLLMFSPGWSGPGVSQISIGTRLASHGFVVAVPTHYGDPLSLLYSWYPPSDHMAVGSLNRPLDVSFVLTHLLQRNAAAGDALFGLMDANRVAAGGHSLGGYAAMVLAAGDDSVCDTFAGAPPGTCVPVPRDPRIKAIVPMDGSNQLLHFYELARVTVPAMGIGQCWDSVGRSYGPAFQSWQARQHAAFSGNPSYRIDVLNTTHPLFSNFCEVSQVLGDKGILTQQQVAARLAAACIGVTPAGVVHTLRTKFTIAFLKTNLVGETGYQRMLTPGWALTREPYTHFFVTEKRNPHSIDDDWPDHFIYFPYQSGSLQARAEKDPLLRLEVEPVGFAR